MAEKKVGTDIDHEEWSKVPGLAPDRVRMFRKIVIKGKAKSVA